MGDKNGCQCCKYCNKCQEFDFQKVLHLKDTGIVTYKYKISANNEPVLDDIFIIQNTKDTDVSQELFLPEFEKRKVDCPRCKHLMNQTEKMLTSVKIIRKNEIKTICEHCRQKLQPKFPCEKCEKAANRFLSTIGKLIEKPKPELQTWIDDHHLLKHLFGEGPGEPCAFRTEKFPSDILQYSDLTLLPGSIESETNYEAIKRQLHALKKENPQLITKMQLQYPNLFLSTKRGPKDFNTLKLQLDLIKREHPDVFEKSVQKHHELFVTQSKSEIIKRQLHKLKEENSSLFPELQRRHPDLFNSRTPENIYELRRQLEIIKSEYPNEFDKAQQRHPQLFVSKSDYDKTKWQLDKLKEDNPELFEHMQRHFPDMFNVRGPEDIHKLNKQLELIKTKHPKEFENLQQKYEYSEINRIKRQLDKLKECNAEVFKNMQKQFPDLFSGSLDINTLKKQLDLIRNKYPKEYETMQQKFPQTFTELPKEREGVRKVNNKYSVPQLYPSEQNNAKRQLEILKNENPGLFSKLQKEFPDLQKNPEEYQNLQSKLNFIKTKHPQEFEKMQQTVRETEIKKHKSEATRDVSATGIDRNVTQKTKSSEKQKEAWGIEKEQTKVSKVGPEKNKGGKQEKGGVTEKDPTKVADLHRGADKEKDTGFEKVTVRTKERFEHKKSGLSEREKAKFSEKENGEVSEKSKGADKDKTKEVNHEIQKGRLTEKVYSNGAEKDKSIKDEKGAGAEKDKGRGLGKGRESEKEKATEVESKGAEKDKGRLPEKGGDTEKDKVRGAHKESKGAEKEKDSGDERAEKDRRKLKDMGAEKGGGAIKDKVRGGEKEKGGAAEKDKGRGSEKVKDGGADKDKGKGAEKVEAAEKAKGKGAEKGGGIDKDKGNGTEKGPRVDKDKIKNGKKSGGVEDDDAVHNKDKIRAEKGDEELETKGNEPLKKRAKEISEKKKDIVKTGGAQKEKAKGDKDKDGDVVNGIKEKGDDNSLKQDIFKSKQQKEKGQKSDNRLSKKERLQKEEEERKKEKTEKPKTEMVQKHKNNKVFADMGFDLDKPGRTLKADPTYEQIRVKRDLDALNKGIIEKHLPLVDESRSIAKFVDLAKNKKDIENIKKVTKETLQKHREKKEMEFEHKIQETEKDLVEFNLPIYDYSNVKQLQLVPGLYFAESTIRVSPEDVKVRRSSIDDFLLLSRVKTNESRGRRPSYSSLQAAKVKSDSSKGSQRYDRRRPNIYDKQEIIVSNKIVKRKGWFDRDRTSHGAILYHNKLSISSIIDIQEQEESEHKNIMEDKKKGKTPQQTIVDGSGVINYALSDRSFIDKGWTLLPEEKVVRKVNIYKMRPSHPEFNWFEHNKKKGILFYETGEKLADFEEPTRGCWYYRNGKIALDYYDAEEVNAGKRFVVYSNGEKDEMGRPRPFTVLATFDYLGNGIIFDHAGNIRLKYNQHEGILMDTSIGPANHWKWNILNDPPILQNVMVDTQLKFKDPAIIKLGMLYEKNLTEREDDDDMIAIEFDNFLKYQNKKMSTKRYKSFPINMKVLKLNENFSLRIIDQTNIYLTFRDCTARIKINLGMVLDQTEIIDTDTANLGEICNTMERMPANTDSVMWLQKTLTRTQNMAKYTHEGNERINPSVPVASADKLKDCLSKPLRRPLMTLEPNSSTASTCKKPTNLYYNTYDTHIY